MSDADLLMTYFFLIRNFFIPVPLIIFCCSSPFLYVLCRCLRTLFLEESAVAEKEGDWLHELATNNSVIETLNFYMTDLRVAWQDLELIARNCKSLISLKISECDISYLVGFFRSATTLEEFGGGSFDDQIGETNKYEVVQFPPKLCRLGLSFMGTNEMQIIFPIAASLKKLDLQYTFLSTEDHCELIQRCPNLEIIEVSRNRNLLPLTVSFWLTENCTWTSS